MHHLIKIGKISLPEAARALRPAAVPLSISNFIFRFIFLFVQLACLTSSLRALGAVASDVEVPGRFERGPGPANP